MLAYRYFHQYLSRPGGGVKVSVTVSAINLETTTADDATERMWSQLSWKYLLLIGKNAKEVEINTSFKVRNKRRVQPPVAVSARALW